MHGCFSRAAPFLLFIAPRESCGESTSRYKDFREIRAGRRYKAAASGIYIYIYRAIDILAFRALENLVFRGFIGGCIF